MKLRICSEGVCFLKAFRFTAADLKRGLFFSGSICRSARGEPAALASAARFTQSCFCDQSQKLFLGMDMEEKLSFASAAQAILHRGRQKHEMSSLAWLQTNKQVFPACRDGQQWCRPAPTNTVIWAVQELNQISHAEEPVPCHKTLWLVKSSFPHQLNFFPLRLVASQICLFAYIIYFLPSL